jgi:hypothetical protein
MLESRFFDVDMKFDAIDTFLEYKFDEYKI